METIGNLIDKLTVVNLKVWAFEDVKRDSRNDSVIAGATLKTNALLQQRNDLIQEIDELVLGLVAGTKEMKTYQQGSTKKYGSKRQDIALILSYPRSGNHLVRYVVECLTGRATLGCSDNRKVDSPIYRRSGVKLLSHVQDSDPIAKKSHIGLELDNRDSNKLMMILRHPIEAILSHDSTRSIEEKVLWFLDNLKYYDECVKPKCVVSYEDLAFENYAYAVKQIASFFEISDVVVNVFLQAFDVFRKDALGSLIRPAKSNLVKYYSSRLAKPELDKIKFQADSIMRHHLIRKYYDE